MPMFYFRFEARPKASSATRSHAGGAMINCWIESDTREEAESYARGSIADQDWEISRLEEAGVVTRETQAPEEMEYFEQVEIDKNVFVFLPVA